MQYRYLAAVAAAASLHVCAALAADTCSLLPQADAAALLGQASIKAAPAGPERDEDSGGQLSYCTYRAATSATAAVVVSVVEFPSDAAARKQLTKNLVVARMEDDNAKVSEEPGLGERSFYGDSGKASMYVFLKKNKVVGVSIGGAKPSPGAASKESLRRAAQTVASKV